jgi:cell division protein FtsQ
MGKSKNIIKKVFFLTVWLLVGAGTVVLLIAAARQQNEKVCTGVLVQLIGPEGVEYVSKQQILSAISGGRPDLLEGTKIKTFDLQQLEELLEQNLWIRNAELFFDNTGVLRIDIIEREPVARIFSVSGESFYIDETGQQLPTKINQVARVPVFTSFPAMTYPLSVKDSLLLMQVKDIGTYLLKHKFWMAQIEQVDINNYELELVPKLGKHLILFGEGIQAEQKFNRLLMFYKQVMKKAGWNYYSVLDLRFQKQLVAVRRDSSSLFESFAIPKDYQQFITPPVDSNLVRTESDLMEAPVSEPEPTPAVISVTKDSVQKKILPVKSATPAKKVPEEEVLKEVKKQTIKKAETMKEPKAVMPKKDTTNNE